MSDEKHMIRLTQAVAEGYCSRSTLYRYIRKGALPAVRKKNAFYVAREDLEALGDEVPVTSEACTKHLCAEVTRALPFMTSQDRQLVAALLWPGDRA